MICPRCNSDKTVKNGRIHNGKPKFKCKVCSRQLFVEDPQNWTILDSTKQIIDKLLLERISLAGICRAGVFLKNGSTIIRPSSTLICQVSGWLNQKKGKLTVQIDELWSFVNHKDNKQWVWIAIDAKTREIVGLHLGDRSQASAKALWDSLLPVYRLGYTDFWEAYQGILPSKRHRAVHKNTGKTHLIERLNGTLR